MARFLAIDWDDSECRYVLASVQRGVLDIRKVGSVPLEPVGEESETSTSVDNLPNLIASLQRLVREERIDSCPVLLGLGRGKVEMFYRHLPPCRESEIPLMLKNQILRDHSGYSDFDPLDYLVLDDTDGSRKLLALTIPLSYRQNLVRRFRLIGRTPVRIGFRPVDAAELVLRDADGLAEDEYGLIVDVVGSDVDLVVVNGRRIVSIRSFRLPDLLSFAQSVERIGQEVDRTLTVGLDELVDHPIRKVFLFGDEDDWKSLIARLEGSGYTTTIINPFAWGGGTTGVVAASTPESPGRYAPLIGLLLRQMSAKKAEADRGGIDFLHPKEAPKPTNYVRVFAMVFLLLLMAGYGLYRWNHSAVREMEENLARLETEYREVASQYNQLRPIWSVLVQAGNWEAQNVVWLDELRELCLVLPDERDLVVTRISLMNGPVDNNPRFAGTIQLNGMVRDPSVLMTLQKSLNARGTYQMPYPAPTVNPAGGGYPWLFQVSIVHLRR